MDPIETVVADAPQKLYSLATVAGAAVAGSLLTAAGFVVTKYVEKRREAQAIEAHIEPDTSK